MFNLKQYHDKSRHLHGLLPWAFMIEPGTIVDKDGSFLKAFEFRGPDLESVTEYELKTKAAQVNNALKRLEDGWGIFIEAQRFKSRKYPQSTFPDPVSRAIDRERAATLTKEKFESRYFLALAYLPPSEQSAKLTQKMIENRSGSEKVDYNDYLVSLKNDIKQIYGILNNVFAFLEPLEGDGLLTYLHSCVSTKRHTVRMPAVPTYLDAYITDQGLTPGLEPRLGEKFFRILTLKGFPMEGYPGMLDALNRLDLPYRWVTRFLPLSKTAAQSEISNYRKRWFAKRKPMMSVIMEAVTKSASELMNEEALAKANDAESALGELGDDLVTYGYFTATITVFGKTFDEANARIAECEKAVNNQAMVAHTEDFNAVEAWLSSIPGHCYANVRKPLLHTLNLAHLIPISGIWAGDERNNHLKGPALMHVVTGGNTPFRYSHHVGDVGHKLIIGPTGNGKSVFMCLCEAQFLRYPNAQLFIFDIFGSARIPVYALGGEFYDIDAVGPQFQPFRRIDEPAERVWATEWVISILEHERITPSINAKSDVETAMRNLASVPVSQRTITGLSSLVQSTEIRQCLAMHAIGGAYGGIMDSNAENLSLSRLVCFELGQLIDSSILPIVSSYLFHRVTQRLTGAPTAIYVDEAWKQLENPYMKKQLKDWLITTRKANGSIIFASAGLSEIIDNPITPTLLESCMTKVFLPNSQAQKPEMEKIYKRFGLNERQIEILAQAIPKKDYYVSSAKGNRLFELALGPLQLEFLARSGKEDQKIARAIYEAHGKEAFPAKWLEAKGKADLIPLLAGDFDREEQRILAEIQGLKEKLATVRELKIKAA